MKNWKNTKRNDKSSAEALEHHLPKEEEKGSLQGGREGAFQPKGDGVKERGAHLPKEGREESSIFPKKEWRNADSQRRRKAVPPQRRRMGKHHHPTRREWRKRQHPTRREGQSTTTQKKYGDSSAAPRKGRKQHRSKRR